MNRIFTKKTALAIALLTLGSSAMADGKIATVDMRKVQEKYWKRPQAEQALKDQALGFQKDEKVLVEEFNKMKEEYDKLVTSANDQSVTPAEREKRKSSAESLVLELQTKQKSIRAFEENASEKLESLRKRMLEKIISEIRETVNAKAKTSGFAMVIDSSADCLNQTPVVLFNNGENDMTEAVVTQLNAGAPAATSSADAVKTSAPDVKK